jgi:hypothetical protein
MRLVGILIMAVSTYLILDVLIPHSNWHSDLRTYGIFGFFVGLLLVVEGIAMEIRQTRRANAAMDKM